PIFPSLPSPATDGLDRHPMDTICPRTANSNDPLLRPRRSRKPPMYLPRPGRVVALLLLLAPTLPAQEVPPWLPRYDLDIRIDVAGHTVKTRQQITWTNRHHRPTREVVFNAHSHYKVPKGDLGFFAKTLELLRMSPKEALDTQGEALQVDRAYLIQDGRLVKLPFQF